MKHLKQKIIRRLPCLRNVDLVTAGTLDDFNTCTVSWALYG